MNVPLEELARTVRCVVALDADGAVVVAAERLEAIWEAALAGAAREGALRGRLEQGAITYDLHGLRQQVESRR